MRVSCFIPLQINCSTPKQLLHNLNPILNLLAYYDRYHQTVAEPELSTTNHGFWLSIYIGHRYNSIGFLHVNRHFECRSILAFVSLFIPFFSLYRIADCLHLHLRSVSRSRNPTRQATLEVAPLHGLQVSHGPLRLISTRTRCSSWCCWAFPALCTVSRAWLPSIPFRTFSVEPLRWNRLRCRSLLVRTVRRSHALPAALHSNHPLTLRKNLGFRHIRWNY